jgi:hypothetical protein
VIFSTFLNIIFFGGTTAAVGGLGDRSTGLGLVRSGFGLSIFPLPVDGGGASLTTAIGGGVALGDACGAAADDNRPVLFNFGSSTTSPKYTARSRQLNVYLGGKNFYLSSLARP